MEQIAQPLQYQCFLQLKERYRQIKEQEKSNDNSLQPHTTCPDHSGLPSRTSPR